MRKTGGPAPHPLLGGERRSAFAGQVLGIDPSLRGTGLALIEFKPERDPVLLRCRTVTVATFHVVIAKPSTKPTAPTIHAAGTCTRLMP